MLNFILQRLVFRARAAKEDGQILILFAIMLPGMIAMLGLGLDGANLFAERNSMQGAADLAALAGAAKLPDAPAAAIDEAEEYANLNGFAAASGIDVEVVSPYSGANAAIPASEKIQVEISQPVQTFFLSLLGIDSVDVSVTAVAYRPKASGGEHVFFANRQDCSGSPSNPTYALEFHGGNDTVKGAIHSNGSIRIQGGSYKLNVGSTGLNTYVCNKSTNPGVTVDLTKTSTKAFPVSFAYSDFSCTYTLNTNQSTLAAWTYPQFFNGQELKDGVYCSSGDIKLGWVPPGPKVTLVAKGKVELTGGLNFDAYSKGVLAYTESSGGYNSPAFNTVGGGSTGSGIIYAPNGHAHIQGGGFNVSIGVYANTIDVHGGGSSFVKSDSGGGTAGPARLIE